MEAKIEVLRVKTKREYKDVEVLKRSATKRLLVRLKSGGKKDAVGERLEREEKEFIEALEAQQEEEEGMTALKAELVARQDENVELKEKVNDDPILYCNRGN